MLKSNRRPTPTLKTRIIRVTLPQDPNTVLFEATVTIANLDTKLVEKIEGIDIKYVLRKPKGPRLIA